LALLLSQHKVIEWLIKQISKHESVVNNKEEVKKAKEEQEQELARENTNDYIRKNSLY
jgi:hypothetical protein